MSAGEIADNFKFSKATISHHLELLQRANLVKSTKKGLFIFYSLNTTVLTEVSKWIIALMEKTDMNEDNRNHN